MYIIIKMTKNIACKKMQYKKIKKYLTRCKKNGMVMLIQQHS